MRYWNLKSSAVKRILNPYVKAGGFLCRIARAEIFWVGFIVRLGVARLCKYFRDILFGKRVVACAVAYDIKFLLCKLRVFGKSFLFLFCVLYNIYIGKIIKVGQLHLLEFIVKTAYYLLKTLFRQCVRNEGKLRKITRAVTYRNAVAVFINRIFTVLYRVVHNVHIGKGSLWIKVGKGYGRRSVRTVGAGGIPLRAVDFIYHLKFGGIFVHIELQIFIFQQ